MQIVTLWQTSRGIFKTLKIAQQKKNCPKLDDLFSAAPVREVPVPVQAIMWIDEGWRVQYFILTPIVVIDNQLDIEK